MTLCRIRDMLLIVSFLEHDLYNAFEEEREVESGDVEDGDV